MLYVDVILPLPLDGTFTYSVPDTLAPKVKPGMRLVVPLGKSKTYTAIALTLAVCQNRRADQGKRQGYNV